MKITVKNVDGRLGTGVASLSYTTQRDGGVTETVNAASPVKPEVKKTSPAKKKPAVKTAVKTAGKTAAKPAQPAVSPDYAALADIPVPTPAPVKQAVKKQPSVVRKNASKAVPEKQQGTVRQTRTQQRPKSAVQDDYAALKELARAYYIPGTGRTSRQTPGFESRLVDTLSGAGKTYGGSLAGFGGLSAELLEALDRNAAQSSPSGQRARQEAENIRRYQAMLDNNMWANGVPLTAEDREKIAGYIQSAQRFIDTEQARQENVHAPIRKAADSAYGAAARLTESGQRDIDRAKAGLNGLGRFAVDVGVAGAQMGLDFAPSILTGGGSALVPMFFRSAGGGALAGKDSGADLATRTAYALGSGALSVATEQISNIAGPFRKLFGAGAADRIAARLVERFGENGAVQVMNRLSQTAAGRTALAAFGEGAEEFIEGLGQAFLQEATITPTDDAPPDMVRYAKNSMARFDPVEAGYEFLIGAALGGLGGGVDVLRRCGAQTAANETESGLDSRQAQPKGTDTPVDLGASERISDPLMDAVRRGGRLTDTPVDMQKEFERFIIQKDGAEAAPKAEADLLSALLPQGKRVSLQDLSAGQLSAVEAANARGTVDVDAKQQAYQVNPEEHIDRRKSYDMGRRTVNAFQFDHPQLHEFYRGAAEALLNDLAQTQKGGEFIRAEGDYYGGRRLSRFTSPAIEALLDEYRLSYGQIEKALNAIIQDKGQENYAAAKRVELVLDDMLSNGFKDVEGRPYGPDEAYIAAKAEIAGSLEAETEAAPQPDLGVMGQEIQRHFGKKDSGPEAAPQSFLMDFAELHRRILEEQAKGESALTEIRGRDTIGETGESEVTPYEQVGREHRESRQEDTGAFSRRSLEEGRSTYQIGDYIFGFRTVQGEPSLAAQATREALNALGVPSLIVESQAEWNHRGQSHTSEISEAATIAKKLVAISNNMSLNPQTVAGHEAFHFWAEMEARADFEDVISDNIDFSSDAFLDFQDTIARNYFGKEVDISDSAAYEKLMEEVHAYLAGDLHSGEHEAQLRAMLRDYDAVKAAWDTLAEYGRTHPAEAPQMDGLGAADAGSVNTPFDQMQAETDQFHPINPNAAERVVRERGRAPADVPVENPGTGQNIRKLASTILNSPLTSNEMAPIIESAIAEGALNYGVITDRGALMQAQEAIRKNGYQAAARQVIVKAELGQRLGKYDGVQAIVAYNAAVEAGDHVTAYEVLTALGEASTDAAQLNQAMHLLNRMTPEGKLLSLRRMADRMSQRQNRNGQRRSSLAELDAEAQRADFVEQRTGFQISDELAADYLSAETEEARAEAWDAIVQDLASQIPNTLWDKWNAWRYTAMLTNPTTHVRNFLGNVAAQLQRKVKNAMGAVLEGGMVRDQSQRTKSFLGAQDRGLLDFARGQYEADQAAAMGQGKYAEGSPGAIMQEIQAKRKVLDGPFQWLSEKNSALLDAEDVWFNRPAYVDSFAQALKAKGVTAEEAASGAKAELVEAARAYAVREAQRATFRDANAFSDFVARLGRYEGDNPVAKGFALLTDAMLPFRRTPANVLVRGLEYSPAGLAKAIYEGAVKVRKGDVTAAEMVDHLASGLTGTGVFALGGLLASLGLLALRHGDDDRERNFLRDAGFQDFALQIGGQSYTLSWLTPSAMPLFAGAAMAEAWAGQGGSFRSFLEGMKSVTDSVLETSMLSSLNQLLEGMSYAESKPWYILSSLLGDYVSQAVPTVLGKAASAADPYVRSAYVPAKTGELEKDVSFFLQGIQRKTPGARNRMQPKIDLWGREVSNGGTSERMLENFLSPGFYGRVSDDALTKELQRLADAAGSSGVYPARADKSFVVDGETKILTAEEYTRYAKTVGKTRYDILKTLIGREGYRKLSDEDKARTIAAVYEYANAVGKMEVSSYRPEGAVLELFNSPLDPATFFLYKRMMAIEDAKQQGGAQANANVREALYKDSTLTPQEKNLLDDLIIHDMTIIPRDKDVDYSNQDSFAVSQMSDSAVRRWQSVHEAFPELSGEDYKTAWEICQRRGTTASPYTQERKQRDLMEALGLSQRDAWRLIQAVKG